MKSVPDLVIDTNVLISSLIGRAATAPILEALFHNEFRLVTSEELLKEFRRVTRRPVVAKCFEIMDLVNALLHIEAHAKLVMPHRTVQACRDLKDNLILEVALAGSADGIITGDEDLLVLKTFEKIPIIKPNEFLTWLKRR